MKSHRLIQIRPPRQGPIVNHHSEKVAGKVVSPKARNLSAAVLRQHVEKLQKLTKRPRVLEINHFYAESRQRSTPASAEMGFAVYAKVKHTVRFYTPSEIPEHLPAGRNIAKTNMDGHEIE